MKQNTSNMGTKWYQKAPKSTKMHPKGLQNPWKIDAKTEVGKMSEKVTLGILVRWIRLAPLSVFLHKKLHQKIINKSTSKKYWKSMPKGSQMEPNCIPKSIKKQLQTSIQKKDRKTHKIWRTCQKIIDFRRLQTTNYMGKHSVGSISVIFCKSGKTKPKDT